MYIDKSRGSNRADLFSTISSVTGILGKKRNFDLKSQMETQINERRIKEQKRNYILKALEFLAGDSVDAKILRLSRPTHSFKKKKINYVKYAKDVK